MEIKDLSILKDSIKTEQEVIDLIGEDTPLGFEFLGQGIALYRTLTPIKMYDRLIIFEVDLEVSENIILGICKYDSLGGMLRDSIVKRLVMTCDLFGETVTLFYNP